MSDWEEDFNKQRLEFLKGMSPEKMLRELLAHLHGDGGHHTEKVGLAKSVFDAEQRQETRPHETIVIPQDDCEKQAWFIIAVMRNMKKDEIEMLCKNLLARFDIDLGKLIQHVNQIKDEKLTI